MSYEFIRKEELCAERNAKVNFDGFVCDGKIDRIAVGLPDSFQQRKK